MGAAKYEMKVGDDIKYAEPQSCFVHYGTIIKINKTTYRIKDEFGIIETLPKSWVWLD